MRTYASAYAETRAESTEVISSRYPGPPPQGYRTGTLVVSQHHAVDLEKLGLSGFFGLAGPKDDSRQTEFSNDTENTCDVARAEMPRD